MPPPRLFSAVAEIHCPSKLRRRTSTAFSGISPDSQCPPVLHECLIDFGCFPRRGVRRAQNRNIVYGFRKDALASNCRAAKRAKELRIRTLLKIGTRSSTVGALRTVGRVTTQRPSSLDNEAVAPPTRMIRFSELIVSD